LLLLGPKCFPREERSLTSFNEEALRDNIRIVATFLDPPPDRRRRQLHRANTKNTPAPLSEVAEGARISEAGGCASAGESAGSQASGGAAGAATPRPHAGSRKESALTAAHHLYAKGPAVPSRQTSSRSLPPIATPPGSARVRSNPRWPPPTPRQRGFHASLAQKGLAAHPSSERMRKIMAALYLETYRGIPQVRRQVLSGDTPPRSKSDQRSSVAGMDSGGDAEAPGDDEAEDRPASSPLPAVARAASRGLDADDE